jgi:serine/threonine-protein kinase HipA
MDLRVMLGEDEVGRLRYGSGVAYFAYSREWLQDGFPISPHSLPLEDRLFKGRTNYFEGLPGVFADSLPGGWGMLTAVRSLANRGVDYRGLNPLEKLSYTGRDAKGALRYVPSGCDWDVPPLSDPDELCMECISIMEDESTDMDDIFRRAGSTGGARPKVNAVIDGEDWIVKFRERHDPGSIGRMEFEYNEAASRCGIDVPEHRLLSSGMCDGYFASKRFDRDSGRRIHMISLSGLLEVPTDMPLLDYMSFLQATRYVTRSQAEVVKAFRLSCFNVLAKNYDDHPGNFSFLYLLDEGRYVLSPGYDLTRTPSMREHHMTCVGNPLPGEKELFALASEMNIPRGQAEEIVAHVGDVVSEDLSEWL